jgi:pimeloyl-ACP methyl ester carboxylesterase
VQLEVIRHLPIDRLTHRWHRLLEQESPILFVHGAWHAAWCWENFLPYFADRGYAAYAVSLRGHGASAGRDGIRWHSAAHDYVADIAQVIETLPQPPILVGHSMGGYVVQKYLETHQAAAGVLLASVPVSGLSGFARRFGLRHPWTLLKSQLLLNSRLLIETAELAQEAFFSPNVSLAEIDRHFVRLQQESFRVELEATLLNLPQPKRVKTPMLVLAAANDRVFSVAEEQATARAYGTEAVVFPDMAHDMMLEANWQQVADRIFDWLQEREL